MKSPGSAAPFITVSYVPIENEKAVLDENWDDVCLDVDSLDAGGGTQGNNSGLKPISECSLNLMSFKNLIKFANQCLANLPGDLCNNLGMLL